MVSVRAGSHQPNTFSLKVHPTAAKLPDTAHPKKYACPRKTPQREKCDVVHGRRLHARVRRVHERMGGQPARRWQHCLPGGKARPHVRGDRGLFGAHRRDKQRRRCFTRHVARELLEVLMAERRGLGTRQTARRGNQVAGIRVCYRVDRCSVSIRFVGPNKAGRTLVKSGNDVHSY